MTEQSRIPSDNISLDIETSGQRQGADEERAHLVKAIEKLGKGRDYGQAVKLNRMEAAVLMLFITELTMQNGALTERLGKAEQVVEGVLPKKKMWTPFSQD